MEHTTSAEKKSGSRAILLPEDPENLLDFQSMFQSEIACLRYLEQVRWPGGFACEKCSWIGDPFRVSVRPRVLTCRSCRHEASVTAGTVMHRSKTPILVWFWAAYLIATQTPGISALEVQKKLGITRYETAFQLMHKLRSAMVRPNRDKIGAEWPLEMDLIYIGGQHKSGLQGMTDNTPVIIAVEIKRREMRDANSGKVIKRGLAGRVRIEMLSSKSPVSIDKFANSCIAPNAIIFTDGGGEFRNLSSFGFNHKPSTMLRDRAKMDACLPIVSTVTANLKAWINGTFHGIRKQHLQAYLNEFTFRFNRRFYRSISFRTLLGLGTHRAGQTYAELYNSSRKRQKTETKS